MTMKSRLFFAENFVDVRYKSINNRELRYRARLQLAFMSISQGKPSIAGDFRIVQKTYNIMFQFFDGFESTIHTLWETTYGADVEKDFETNGFRDQNNFPISECLKPWSHFRKEFDEKNCWIWTFNQIINVETVKISPYYLKYLRILDTGIPKILTAKNYRLHPN